MQAPSFWDGFLSIAKLHSKIADTRKDFLHKLSTKVNRENQVIVFQDLNVSGMVKNRQLARAISLQGWSGFREFCEAKSEKLNRDFRVINRWEPTSQICSECGYKWGFIKIRQNGTALYWVICFSPRIFVVEGCPILSSSSPRANSI